MSRCERDAPLRLEDIVEYFAGELSAEDDDRIEAHLFACAACSEAASRIAAVTETLRSLVPPVVTEPIVAKLRASGQRVEDNVVLPETRSHVTFEAQDFIIHHLAGLSLADAERVDVAVRVEETGELLVDQPHAPFDREKGEVLVACRRHFASFPPNVVFVVTATARGKTHATRYTVEHAFR